MHTQCIKGDSKLRIGAGKFSLDIRGGWGQVKGLDVKKIQQKHPSRDVLRKRCSEIMQQIYRRTPMSKCEFKKLDFGMGVLQYIKFAACLFSQRILIRTLSDNCF